MSNTDFRPASVRAREAKKQADEAARGFIKMAAAHADVVAEVAEANAAILRTANSLQDGYEYVLSGDGEELNDAGILEAVTITARALADIDKSDSPWPQIAELTGREITEEAADVE